jgi:hypothetical protein
MNTKKVIGISAQGKIEVAVSIGVSTCHRKLRLCLLAHWEMKRRLRAQNFNYGRFDFEVISSGLTECMVLRIYFGYRGIRFIA